MSRLNYVTGGYTPLMMAAEEGNLSRVKQFIPKSQLNQKNDSGYSALALAVKSGHLEIVQELIRQGSDINSRNNAGQSILFMSSWYNHEPITFELIKAGADVDAYDQRGWTPLMIAVYHNHIKIVKILLDSGANPKHKDSFGKDCLSRCKSSEIKELLMPRPEKSKSPKKNISKSRDPTPKKPQSVAIYKSPTNGERSEEKMIKFRDELERHIKASATTLACHAAEDCMTKLRRTLATEMNKAYERLYENALTDLNHHMQDLYNSMAQRLLDDLEGSCRGNGLNIPAEYRLQSLQLPVHAKRGPPKLPPQNFGRVYDQLVKTPSKIVSSKEPALTAEELEVELYDFIDKEIEGLSEKLDIISSGQIKEEVAARVQQISQFISQEMEHNISSMISRLYMELQAVVEDRMQEILAANLQPMSRPPSAPLLPKLNLNVLKEPNDQSDYIQSIANNYRKN